MGNFINSEQSVKDKNKQTIKRFKNLRLYDVHAVFQDYIANYLHLQHLTWDQFDEIFSPLLNNTLPVFEILEESQTVNIRQALIGLTIFSVGDFDDKLYTLFSAFDLDNSGAIDRKELGTFISEAIYCLCKVVGLK